MGPVQARLAVCAGSSRRWAGRVGCKLRIALDLRATNGAHFVGRGPPLMLDVFTPELLASLLACLCMTAASLGMPVPTLPALIYAGSVVAIMPEGGRMLGLLSFVGAVGGGLFGDSIWYVAGRRHGFRVLRLDRKSVV